MSGMSHGGHGGLRPTQPTAEAFPRYNADAYTSSLNFNNSNRVSENAPFGSSMSPPDSAHRPSQFLHDALFPEWNDGAARPGMGNPDEMQRKDPLATQIWKLYSRTKSQLPNQERMENLTWRMMAMSLKRKEQERSQPTWYESLQNCSPGTFAHCIDPHQGTNQWRPIRECHYPTAPVRSNSHCTRPVDNGGRRSARTHEPRRPDCAFRIPRGSIHLPTERQWTWCDFHPVQDSQNPSCRVE